MNEKIDGIMNVGYFIRNAYKLDGRVFSEDWSNVHIVAIKKFKKLTGDKK